MFRFLHAADVHLDSPLRGLDRYEGAPVDEIRGATRTAFRALIDLAIGESVDFVLLAGDLYDGDWRDYSTGLLVHRELSRLREAGIRVFLISGNHDAASQITKHLRLPEGVTRFPVDRPATETIDDLRVAIHGQGFGTREVREDLSKDYPQPLASWFNIGMLHTSADGREGHASYAPCRVGDLVSHGYDYWALGHVHAREILNEDPWIVFPGCVQGRHIRESGEKGCTLVTVSSDQRVSIEHRALDVLRWRTVDLDISEAEELDDVYSAVERRVESELETADGRFLALRWRLKGECVAHDRIAEAGEAFTEQVRAVATDIGLGRVWIEKLVCETKSPSTGSEPAGDIGIESLLESIGAGSEDSEDELLGEIAKDLAPLLRHLPSELTQGADALDLSDPEALKVLVAQARQQLVPRLLRSEGGA